MQTHRAHGHVSEGSPPPSSPTRSGPGSDEQQPSPSSSSQSSLSPKPFFSRGSMLGSDRIPPPSVADVEVSPTCSQRCFVPGHGLLRRGRDGPSQPPPRLVVEDWRWSQERHTREKTTLPNTEDVHQRSDQRPPPLCSTNRRQHHHASEDRGLRPVLGGRRTSLELLLTRERRRRSVDGRSDIRRRPEGRQQVRFQSRENTDGR